MFASPRCLSTDSPCPATPCYMVPNHFAAQQKNFPTIEASVNRALHILTKEFPDCIDYGYMPDVTQWRLKYLQGSDLREIQINCYWDANLKDHFVEMNRVKGDGLFSPTSRFYETIRQQVLGDNYIAPVIKPGCRPPLTAMPKLPAEFTKIDDEYKQRFLKGADHIFAMADGQYFEPRLEAVKALCDLAAKDRLLIEQDACREKVVRSLNALLVDEFPDIVQFAVIATAKFAEVPSYKEPLSQMASVHSLVSMITNPLAVPLLAYETAQMRRKAATTLLLVMNENVADVFHAHGIHLELDFRLRVKTIPEELKEELLAKLLAFLWKI